MFKVLWGLGVILLILFLYSPDATGNQIHTGNRLDSSLIAYASPITTVAVWEEPKTNSNTHRGDNCVLFLREHGIPVPRNPLIYAKYLPVDSTDLPPQGVKVILVSYASELGHVSYGYNDNGTLKVLLDSAGIKEIPRELFKGYIEV